MDDLNNFLRNYFGGQGTDPFGRQQQDGPVTLSEKKKRFILSELNKESRENLFEQNTKTFIDHEGPKVIETSTVYIAGCGHLIGLNNQNIPSGLCSVCKQLICSECSSTRCKKCNSIICKECSSDIDDDILCNKCRSSYLRKKYVSSVVKTIHDLLSREF